jgi:aryl sulfotransferase
MAPRGLDKMMIQHEAAYLREVFDAGKCITDYLSTEGFEDIDADESAIVWAIARNVDPQVIAYLTAQKVISERALGRIADGLIPNGYLEFRDNPDAPRRKMLALTERGVQVHSMIGKAISIKRWADFSFRQGDVVIATLPKSGTTWVQMICALLIFQTPRLPAPLQELSPWLERQHAVRDELYSQFASLGHRRFIKTHLLPGEIPVDARATYIVLARHPLDCTVSMYHVIARDIELSGSGQWLPPPRQALLDFINGDSGVGTGQVTISTLRSWLRWLSCAWEHRDAPNVVFVHYEDLLRDLEGQMRRLAGHLGITVPEVAWAGLVRAATFEQMRAAADQLQPLPGLQDQPEAARLAPPDLLAWLHR